MKSPSLDFFEMLRVLSDHKVAHIVVGGVCGVLHGAPITTYDLDVVRATDTENIAKLMSALEDLDGYSRLHQKKIRPDASHLKAPGHLLLQTRFGHLDLLGTIGAGRDYQYLRDHTVTGTIRGISFQMLDLETLIRIKEETGREKDHMVLPILRATLEERPKNETN